MTIFYWITQLFFKIIFKIFYRLKVSGIENILPGKGIIAPNHTSFFDPPIISAACPEEIHYLARDTLFDNFLFKALIKKLNAHPVSGTAQDLHSFKIICGILKNEDKVVIFPEGERAEDGQLKEIKTGVAMLAMRCKAPIIPTHIQGAYDAWPRGQIWPKPWGKITCVFGKPILMEEFFFLDKKEAQKAIVIRLQYELEQLKALDQAKNK